MRGVADAEAEVEGGGRRPAVRPEGAPPGGERARANGGFEREEAEDVQPQRLPHDQAHVRELVEAVLRYGAVGLEGSPNLGGCLVHHLWVPHQLCHGPL